MPKAPADTSADVDPESQGSRAPLFRPQHILADTGKGPAKATSNYTSALLLVLTVNHGAPSMVLHLYASDIRVAHALATS